jgi:hypothetical protein
MKIGGQFPPESGGQFDRILHLNGLLDDIRIFNRALNESEISQLFNEGGW